MDQANHDMMFSFPAIRGTQAGREYYVAMVRLSHLVRLTTATTSGETEPQATAQRALNKARVPALARYLTENPRDYVLSAITASVDGEVQFEALAEGVTGSRLGRLHVSADVPFIINDGQHRRAAIEKAIVEKPELASETIAVVIFVGALLERNQQLFADLNRFPVRPTKSLTILYDHRDPLGRLTTWLADTVPVFSRMTEKTKTTISNRTRKLFTLSSIYHATGKLLGHRDGELTSEQEQLALDFWTAVSENMPDWQAVIDSNVHPAKLRTTKIHAHGVVLQAMGVAGAQLVADHPSDWQDRLAALQTLDWSRGNTDLWEGCALHQGRISKSQASVAATARVIATALAGSGRVKTKPRRSKVT